VWITVVACLAVTHLVDIAENVGEATYLAMTVGAAVAASIGARRQPPRWRFAWSCVAAGLVLSAIGDVIFYVMDVFNRAPLDVSAADIFWVASYIVLGVGLSSLIVVRREARRVDVDGVIDIASFTVLAMIVVIRFTALGGIVSDTSTTLLSRLVSAAYPILDAALLGVIAQAIISRRLHGRSGVFVSCGVGLWLASDFAALLVTDPVEITKWLHVGLMLGAASLAVSTWPSGSAAAEDDDVVITGRVTDARILMTLMPLLVPGAIEVWEFSNGRDANPVPLFVATSILVVLAFTRATRLVKARNRQEAALAHATRFYAALAENSSDAVIVIDRRGQILNEAPNLLAMLGRPSESTTGMDAIGLLRPLDQEDARSIIDRWWSTSAVVEDAEIHATHANGSDRWFGACAANLSADPDVAGLVVNLRDITDRKLAQQELSHHAFHDSLTGLANRDLFHDRLEHALEGTARNGLDVAVVYLDLDEFKMVNDTRGHEAGDRVLREVATRLSGVVRSADTVSRLGGDEFAVLVEERPRAIDEAQIVAQRVLQLLTEPFAVGDQHVVMSASIGIAVGDNACSASSMMRDADVAMYRAKTTGGGKWVRYESDMRTAALERLELESDLHEALDKNQFRLVYQPIVELDSNTVIGFEVLLRWDHPTMGTIDPETFIPIAEANGSIVAIGRWVLDSACRAAAQWQRAYPATPVAIAVNLSGRQIATPELVEHVATALQQSGFTPASLILEMTETVLVQDAEVAAERLQELRSLGVRLAIDDFGTGYSSLSYLRQFPIDILKIDRSFVETITEQSHAPALVRGLLDLAKTLHMKTIAEGIQNTIQLDSLRRQHCDYGQGFLFAKPLNAVDATALIAELGLIPVEKRAGVFAGR
jgi:diguanylate cyclase (GGDEF)-like protein/PAS domain S-box-containing protein